MVLRQDVPITQKREAIFTEREVDLLRDEAIPAKHIPVCVDNEAVSPGSVSVLAKDKVGLFSDEVVLTEDEAVFAKREAIFLKDEVVFVKHEADFQQLFLHNLP